jgi:hypothetical protein
MASGTWNIGYWGQNQWGDNANSTVSLTGLALTATQGDESSAGEINTGWGRDAWGLNAWGEYGDAIPTGIAMTAALGTGIGFTDVVATNSTNNNQTLTVTLASVAIEATSDAPTTGIAMTAAQGAADAGPDAMLTGNAATMALGSISAFNQTGWGRQHWGDNGWGVEGTWISVSVTGQALTTAIGTETVSGDSNITANTLNVAQLTLGNVDPAPDAMIQGNFMIAALGTLGQGSAKTVTGQAMTMALASVVADLNQEVSVTGISMNAQLASASGKTDIDVIPTGFGLTIALGSGSALIWDEVDTGSAPIDPPGWQDVAA